MYYLALISLLANFTFAVVCIIGYYMSQDKNHTVLYTMLVPLTLSILLSLLVLRG